MLKKMFTFLLLSLLLSSGILITQSFKLNSRHDFDEFPSLDIDERDEELLLEYLIEDFRKNFGDVDFNPKDMIDLKKVLSLARRYNNNKIKRSLNNDEDNSEEITTINENIENLPAAFMELRKLQKFFQDDNTQVGISEETTENQKDKEKYEDMKKKLMKFDELIQENNKTEDDVKEVTEKMIYGKGDIVVQIEGGGSRMKRNFNDFKNFVDYKERQDFDTVQLKKLLDIESEFDDIRGKRYVYHPNDAGKFEEIPSDDENSDII